MYFNVNFNVFFKLIKEHLLVSELYIYQNARCNDKKEYINLIFGKGKAIPVHVCTGPEGSRRLRPSDFQTNGTGRW